MLSFIHCSGLFLLDLWIHAFLKLLEDLLHAKLSASHDFSAIVVTRLDLHHLRDPMVLPLDLSRSLPHKTKSSNVTSAGVKARDHLE